MPQTTLCSSPAAAKRGFTLLEVIVALAVAAILGSSLLAMQNQSAKYLEMSSDSLRCLNLMEDILARRYPEDLQTTPSFISWSGAVQGEWRFDQSPLTSTGRIINQELEARSGGYSVTWTWFGLKHGLGVPR